MAHAHVQTFRYYANGVEFFPGAGTRLKFASRAADVLTVVGVPHGTLEGGDTVTVTYKDPAASSATTVFSGTVEQVTESELGGTESYDDAVVSSPWSKLDRLVYQQQWPDYSTGGTVWSSNLVLNQDLNGNSIGFKSQLNEIFNFAKTRVGCTATAITGGQALPFDEVRDLTCAQAINRVLRWFPKKIVRFDYSSGTPNLVLADPVAASWTASIDKSSVVRTVNAHPITGVSLETVTTGDDDGILYRKVENQVYPVGTDPTDVDTLHVSIQLAGTDSSTQYEFLKPHCDDEIDVAHPGWWKKYHPRLAKVNVQDITVRQWSTRIDPQDYPNKTDSSVEELQKFGLKARVEKFTAHVSFRENGGDDEENDCVLQMSFVTSNAEDGKTYSRAIGSSATTGETIPQNLARAIYEDRSQALQAIECTARIGSSFPAIGETWQGLILQSFEVDPSELTLVCRFGQPEHLSADDMASIMTGFRNRIRSTSCWERKDGKRGGDDDPDETIYPVETTEFCPGVKAKMTVKAAAAVNPSSFSLDTARLQSGETVEVHEVTVKGKNGSPKKVKVLATEDFDSGGGILPGRFDISIEEGEEDEDSEPSHAATFSNCYYDVGGKTYETSVEELELSGGEIIALKVTARGSSPSAEIVTYGSLADLQSAQGNKDYYVRPLYKIGSEFAIECDFRTGPTFDMGEFWT